MEKSNAGDSTWQTGEKLGRAWSSWKSCAKGQRQQVSSAGEPVVAQAKELGETGMCYMYACVRACLRQVSRQEGGLSDDGKR